MTPAAVTALFDRRRPAIEARPRTVPDRATPRSAWSPTMLNERGQAIDAGVELSPEPSPILVSCEAGTPVVLFGASELARQLGQIAEELLATGAEVELLAGIERAPARLVEAVKRMHTPGVFALCRRGETPDPKLLKSIFDEATTVRHRWIDCDVGEGTAAIVVPHITRALAELARPVVVAAAGPTVAAADPTEVSAVIALVRPAPPAATVVVARSRRIPAIPVVLAAAGIAIGIVAWLGRVAVDTTPEIPVPRRHAPPEMPVAVAAPPVVSVPRPVSKPPVVAAAPVVAPPTVPPPPPEPIEIADDELSQLERAIERKDVAVHRGLVVAPAIAGERRWHDAMTLCRARPFWYSHGWRVATRKELVALDRAELLPDAPVWSSTRADRRGSTAFIVHGGKSVAEPKGEASALTVCVRPR